MHHDGSSFDGGAIDAHVDGASCTVSSITTACAGPNDDQDCAKYGCKFQVNWTCGDVHFRVGGACAGDTSGGGSCFQDEQPTTQFQVSNGCNCVDASALETFVEQKCTPQ